MRSASSSPAEIVGSWPLPRTSSILPRQRASAWAASPFKKDADSRALGLEMAGSHESVTAVVALAAEDDDPLAPDGRPLAADDVRGAAAGILHEPRAGDPERGDRAGIEGAHLGGREDRPHPYLALAEARRSAPWVRKSASTDV